MPTKPSYNRTKVNREAQKDPKCPFCKGDFTSDGIETKKLPLGFGFATSPRFQVDYLIIKSYTGFCLDCGRSGKVEFSRQIKTAYPNLDKKRRSKTPCIAPKSS